MHIPSLGPNVFTTAASAASQLISGAAGRASSAVKSFESDLDSGNTTGAQSFLSTLQQKISLAGQNSSLSSQLSQIGSDLKSGNVTAAKTDYAQLRQSLSSLSPSSLSHDQSATGAGTASNAALAAYTALQQQSAYSSALNLSMPASMPSLSVSF